MGRNNLIFFFIYSGFSTCQTHIDSSIHQKRIATAALAIGGLQYIAQLDAKRQRDAEDLTITDLQNAAEERDLTCI